MRSLKVVSLLVGSVCQETHSDEALRRWDRWRYLNSTSARTLGVLPRTIARYMYVVSRIRYSVKKATTATLRSHAVLWALWFFPGNSIRRWGTIATARECITDSPPHHTTPYHKIYRGQVPVQYTKGQRLRCHSGYVCPVVCLAARLHAGTFGRIYSEHP